MAAEFHEQREFARVYFSQEEGVKGVFVFPDFEQVSFSAAVLNLSLGGLQFSIKREGMNPIETGKKLILTHLQGDKGLLCDGAIPLEIRWIHDYPVVSNVSFGCEFGPMPERSRKMIAEFVERKLVESRRD